MKTVKVGLIFIFLKEKVGLCLLKEKTINVNINKISLIYKKI